MANGAGSDRFHQVATTTAGTALAWSGGRPGEDDPSRPGLAATDLSTSTPDTLANLGKPMDSTASDVTVALVHGAFADSSCWNEVIERLHEGGVTATAIPNPLRGIEEDAAYVTSALDQIP